LAISANITQAANTRLDHVLLTLGNLWRIYSALADSDRAVRECIHQSLEKRWAKADQDAFILAVFFNPHIRADLFGHGIIQFTPAGVYGLVRRMYKRVFREDPDFELHAACMDYYKAREEFSDDAMHLTDLEASAKAKVSRSATQASAKV
jgi:hypothetical protein